MRKIFYILIALLLILVGVAEAQMPFTPETGKTVTISASTTSADETITTLGAEVMLVTNAGTVMAFVKCGAGAQEATATDTPVPPLTSVIMARGSYIDTCAAITASSTATIYVTPGWGGVYSALQMSGTQKYSGATSLVANTADGADSSSLCLSGGGACSTARGASAYLYGNEVASYGGMFEIDTGATSTGKVQMILRGDGNRVVNFDASSDTAHTLTFGDGGTTALQTLSILASTSDGDDDSYQEQCGGGSGSAARGGCVKQFGNDYGGASAGGEVQIIGGDGSGGSVTMRARGDANRQLKYDAGSDTVLALSFGDGGTTDTQALHISGNTPDEGDDSRVCVGGGGAIGTTRGSYFCADGNENGGSFIINIPDKAGASYVNRIYNSTGTWQYAETYGTTWSKRIVTTTVTPSGATTDTSNFIPAGSVVYGCTARVITAITGATTWSMGTTADTDRYGTGFAVALNTVTTSTNWVPATAGEGVEWHTNAATALRLTAAGSNFTGGSVRIGCMVDSMGAPSS